MKIAKRAWTMRLVNCEAAVVSYKEISKILSNARCGGMCLPVPDALIGTSQSQVLKCSSSYVP